MYNCFLAFQLPPPRDSDLYHSRFIEGTHSAGMVSVHVCVKSCSGSTTSIVCLFASEIDEMVFLLSDRPVSWSLECLREK